MGDNYKVIRRCREAVEELKSQGWTITKIAKTIKISNAVVIDLENLDVVAMNLRQPTVEKMRKFVDTRDAAKQHLADQEKKKEKVNLPPPPKREELPPKMDPVKKEPAPSLGDANNLLTELQNLSKRFAAAGFRLDAAVTLIKYPEQ